MPKGGIYESLRCWDSTLIPFIPCSFGDISAATMFQDMDKLIVGIILMFVYMQVVLSKFSWVELRVRTALH